jgi:hypothetical protein
VVLFSEILILGIDTDAIGTDSPGATAVLLIVFLGLRNQILRLTVRISAKETLGNPGDPRDNDAVIAGQDWVDEWQAARLLGL